MAELRLGDEDDWDACFAVDICAQGEAVPSGKPEIEKNEIRAAVRDLFRYINEVIYNQGLIAFIIQKNSQFLRTDGSSSIIIIFCIGTTFDFFCPSYSNTEQSFLGNFY